MHLVVARDLPAPAAVVWPLLTQPAEVSRWSTAPVRGLDPGDGGGFASVGALRAVRLGRHLRREVEEVVEHADVPHRLVYRVVGTRAVRAHRGEQRLDDVAPGRSRLTWVVDVELPVPGEGALEWSLRRELEASLDRLAALAGRGAGPTGASTVPVAEPGPRFVDDGDRLGLEREVEAVVVAQRALADRLESAGDPRHWFARVYQYVTEALLAHVRSGEVTHPLWALRLVPRFHVLYDRNVARGEGREPGEVETHWRQAFDAISTADGSALAFWRAVVAGARAHIEGDLPRVLADVWVTHYAGRCDHVRFRADFLLMAPAFGDAWDRLTERVPSRWFPPYVRALRSVAPRELTEAILARRFYDPLASRRHAFEEGRRLGDEALRRGGSPLTSPP